MGCDNIAKRFVDDHLEKRSLLSRPFWKEKEKYKRNLILIERVKSNGDGLKAEMFDVRG